MRRLVLMIAAFVLACTRLASATDVALGEADIGGGMTLHYAEAGKASQSFSSTAR